MRLEPWPRQEREGAQACEHAECRAVACRGEGGEDEQAGFLGPRELVAVQDQQKQREHRQAGKDVGEQHAGKPGQRRRQDQQQADRGDPKRLRQPQHAQGQGDDPQRGERLQNEVEPETRSFADMQIEAEHRRAAGHQVALVPSREIAAGVPLEQRIAVPYCGREQKDGDDDGGHADRGQLCCPRA